ncbi:mechanosensitive ion channel family protein [Candidatus Contubernalis alkalaceticus]|nr:mechanosensitive ion channel family protein [Candidatus Contubernalis alkalaceticus]
MGKYGGTALLVFLLFLLLRKTFTLYVFRGITKLLQRRGLDPKVNILNCIEQPLRNWFVVLGLYFALLVLPLGEFFQDLVTQTFRASIIVLIAWGLYNIAGPCLFEVINSKIDDKMDDILIPFISKILRFLIIFLAFSLVASEWGYDVTGIIAGLGLGGLAFALAAQDTAANIFGGIVIITDKPFDIGDWILSPSVEGTVEDISFRSTRIRTFANSLVSVPNSTLAKEPITNWSKMGKRRVSFNLGVTYDTSRDQLKKCVEEIRKMLENHPDVHKEVIFVKFDSFNDSSLDIFIYYFTITIQWGAHMKVKEEINLNIMKILEDQRVSIAFPSRSLYLENLPEYHQQEKQGQGE